MTTKPKQIEQWARKLTAKGMSGAEARATAPTLRRAMADLNDQDFGQWLDTLGMPDILRIVGEQMQKLSGSSVGQGA